MRVIRRHFLVCAVDLAVSLSTHSLLLMVSFVDHATPSASKVVDDSEAPDNNEPEMGRRDSGCPRREGYEGSLVRPWCEAAVAAE